MDRATGIFVDGMGAASATSGILSQLEGRIFALLYLQAEPLSLDDIARELEQSKSNISVNIRGLVEWHLVRRMPMPGSRKDHYEAATDFWRLMQEIIERRHRFTVRQVLAAVDESARVGETDARPRTAAEREETAFRAKRLEALRSFMALLDVGIAAFTKGQPLSPDALRKSPLHAVPKSR